MKENIELMKETSEYLSLEVILSNECNENLIDGVMELFYINYYLGYLFFIVLVIKNFKNKLLKMN